LNSNIKSVSKQFYDNHAIGGAEVSAYQLALSFLLNKDLSDKVVLNVGCGVGIFDALLNKSSPKHYVGIDFSAVQAKKAKNRSRNFDFIAADSENLPIRSEAADLIISTEAIEHFPNFRKAFKEFNRVLSNGNSCLITTPNYDSFLKLVRIVSEWSSGANYTMDQIVEHHFTESSLREELSIAGFDNFEFRGIDLKGNIGVLATALGCLFSTVLRKLGFIKGHSIAWKTTLWQPPYWVLKTGVKPYYTKHGGRFGLGIGLMALKRNSTDGTA
jgi:SAM-dependent methyltransferase